MGGDEEEEDLSSNNGDDDHTSENDVVDITSEGNVGSYDSSQSDSLYSF